MTQPILTPQAATTDSPTRVVQARIDGVPVMAPTGSYRLLVLIGHARQYDDGWAASIEPCPVTTVQVQGRHTYTMVIPSDAAAPPVAATEAGMLALGWSYQSTEPRRSLLFVRHGQVLDFGEFRQAHAHMAIACVHVPRRGDPDGQTLYNYERQLKAQAIELAKAQAHRLRATA